MVKPNTPLPRIQKNYYQRNKAKIMAKNKKYFEEKERISRLPSSVRQKIIEEKYS